MEYQKFLDTVIDQMAASFSGDGFVAIQPILKNNNQKADVLCFKHKDKIIFPIIYLNDCYKEYQNGKAIETIIEEISETFCSIKGAFHWNTEIFTDFSKGKDYIVYRVINYEKNKELLKQLPYRKFLDLAIVYYMTLEHVQYGHCSVLIYQSYCDYWNITEEDLYQNAQANTPRLLPPRICNMNEVIEQLTKIDQQQEFSITSHITGEAVPSLKMYVLTNEHRVYGAVCMLYPGVMEKLADAMQADLYIIPSSIHEVLIFSSVGAGPKTILQQVVKEVNEVSVDEQERLSDLLYCYSYQYKKFLL